MILKFANGGSSSLPPFVSYDPLILNDTNANASSSTTEEKKSKKENLTDDDLLKLLSKMDALPSDVLYITNTFSNFLIDGGSNGGINTSRISSTYLQAIQELSMAKFYRSEYEKAYTKVNNNGGLNEYAINDRGKLVCANSEGDFLLMTLEELLLYPDYAPLTNSELLLLRAHNPALAMNNQITGLVENGIGMKTINELITQCLGSLGTTEVTEEGFVRRLNGVLLKGLEDYMKAKLDSGELNATVDELYKGKLITKSLALLANAALNYIYKILPENAKTLLRIKTQNLTKEEAVELIESLISARTSDTREFLLTRYKKDTDPTLKTSKSSTNKKPTGFDLDPVSMLRAGYGLKSTINIQTAEGMDNAILVYTVQMPIVNKSGSPIGVGTLSDVANSMFAGYLDFNNASMGDASIPAVGFDNIAVDGTALYTAYLPLDMKAYEHDGTIRPDLDLLKRYKEALTYIADHNITDPQSINDVYRDKLLPIMYDSKGDILGNYVKFGMINGTAISDAFNEDVSNADYLFETEDKNIRDNTLRILNQGRSEKDRVDFDEKSFWDGLFGGDYDRVYKGTIFIPVNEDYFTTTAATGNYPNTAEAELIEAKQLGYERDKVAKKTYVKPKMSL